jgi:SAM-dependent methyltransferase
MMRDRTAAEDLPSLYRTRFSAEDRKKKYALWKVLCEQFLQRYVRPTDVVVDLGAGYGEFINHIRCGKKYAVDLNEDTAAAVNSDVVFLKRRTVDLGDIPPGSADIVFASNLFEHLSSKEELLATLGEVRRTLRPGGKLLILQPNIKYAYRDYWDFLDHHLALSHESMGEALELAGFTVVECRPRFMPYSTKSKLPQSPLLLRIYLRVPPLQRLLGGQMFLVGVRAPRDT